MTTNNDERNWTIWLKERYAQYFHVHQHGLIKNNTISVIRHYDTYIAFISVGINIVVVVVDEIIIIVIIVINIIVNVHDNNHYHPSISSVSALLSLSRGMNYTRYVI